MGETSAVLAGALARDAWPGITFERALPGGHTNPVMSGWLGGRRVVVRRSSRPAESLDWELDLLDFLAGQGVGVPRVLPAVDGRRHVDGIMVTDYAGGHHPRDPREWRPVVEQLSIVHAATAGWPQRPGAAASTDLATADRAGDVRLDLLPPRVARAVRNAWAAVRAGSAGVVHGDVSAANVLVDGDRVTLLDWDEARVDVPWFDLAFVPSEAAPPGAVPVAARHAAGLAWEVAYCWAADPVYARRRLVELYRTNAERG
ncbi:hypothetical protein Acy02nite_83660 [Actinoplanes cyaneus]|uniref:Aminoglycoside phosphotransferase domain-containing protein n=1 Tax=Actinoplanes cyaneus TaxID=52696 RepID=A0A919IQR4_9ACTN|nr:phosphotransferase [Actinoplanes cyaneus]MCW2138220.1 Phosphotransferase enzyme family protein [Actinoplanes cyaneus]GID70485.1 hypothetical protein Acy02nite_83660 [Actinoplanes cyaneus]